MTMTDLWDDPTIDDDEREFTEEEMDAVAEAFTLSEDYASDLFSEVPIEKFTKDGQPFGWDLGDLVDWESEDGESRFDT